MGKQESPAFQDKSKLSFSAAAHTTTGKNSAASLTDNRQQSVIQKKATNTTGLPDTLKSGIENLSGHSMDDVKVHYNSDKPAQLNAHAYAQGTDIHVASGQEKHLPHEAWHVVQQKQGRVKPTLQMKGKVNFNDDAGLEKEADVMGDKAMQLKLTGADLKNQKLDTSRNTIQRRLIIGANNLTDLLAGGLHGDLATLVNWAYTQMTTDAQVTADVALHTALGTNIVNVKKQLSKWIENTPGLAAASPKSHPEYGRKQQDRNYANFYDLARGVMGWVAAKPVRHAEKTIATDVYANEPLQAALNGLLVKLFYKIRNLEKEGLVDATKQQNILKELTEGLSIAKGGFDAHHRWTQDDTGARTQLGHYQRYHRQTAAADGNANIDHGIPQNQLTVLSNPTAYGMKDKIILLHDLMEYFGRHQGWNPTTAGEDLLPVETRHETMVTTATDAHGERTASVSMSDGTAADKKRARGMGITTGTRDENAPNTLLARQKGLPVWAGQSMTTVRMMKLAQWAGADGYENAALALGIFAYWRKDYDHRSDFAYHTLFEVLDVAKNFGVNYKMVDGGVHQFPLIDLAGMLTKVENQYRQLVGITQALVIRMRALAVPPLITQQLNALFQEIKQEDTAVKLAHTKAKDALQTDAARNQGLNEIVIRLEIAADKQKKIKEILDAIPVPAPVFNPDDFLA
ncbi:MAG: DUF4157 domain-containing protein [Bacteroidetes bacterium]|nr:DUF4157 domain-containing protein [Bacteroidota bacterium]